MIDKNEVYFEPLRPKDAADMFRGMLDESAYYLILDNSPETLEALHDR